MDHETAHYILTYFSNLLSEQERLAIHHTHSKIKLELRSYYSVPDDTLTRLYHHAGWLGENEEAKDLLKDGYEQFEIKVASKVISQYKEGIFLNTCERCSRLARTPKAKQCRHCGHSWRLSV